MTIHKNRPADTIEPSAAQSVNLLFVTFNIEVKAWEISDYREAFSRQLGLLYGWFDEHYHTDPNEAPFRHNNYPLLQFKANRQHLLLMVFNDAAEPAQRYFSIEEWAMRLQPDQPLVAVKSMQMMPQMMRIWDKIFFAYEIYNYVPLTPEHSDRWSRIVGEEEKLDFLAHQMVKCILNFAAGVRWNIQGHIELKITELKSVKTLKIGQEKHLAFSFKFTTNLYMPDLIGLGIGAACGLGVVRKSLKNSRIFSAP